jgi:hypothetical protein
MMSNDGIAFLIALAIMCLAGMWFSGWGIGGYDEQERVERECLLHGEVTVNDTLLECGVKVEHG